MQPVDSQIKFSCPNKIFNGLDTQFNICNCLNFRNGRLTAAFKVCPYAFILKFCFANLCGSISKGGIISIIIILSKISAMIFTVISVLLYVLYGGSKYSICCTLIFTMYIYKSFSIEYIIPKRKFCNAVLHTVSERQHPPASCRFPSAVF